MTGSNPIGVSNERNRLAAELKLKREQKARGHEWTDEEVAEMEAADEAFRGWEAEIEHLQKLVGP